MDKLFTPDTGLMIWTVITFLLLLSVLGKFGWRPLIEAIESREQRLREEREGAEAARAEAKRIQADLEAKLAALDAKSKEILAVAAKEAEALRARHSAEAQVEAKRLMEKTRAELEEERRRLVAQLRSEVAGLAVTAAEKLVHKSIDDKVRKGVMDDFLKDLDKSGGRHG